jgi:hypothetical protein
LKNGVIQNTYDVLRDTELVYQMMYQAYPQHHKKEYAMHAN